ncbi:hypothetical protein GH714_010310 [Hevea brasiliensis]|uniref:Uncharacterized protein n=1 Tax=Hevea brasiliensis TaxID=3981 RepID=A0A6A6M984_HEVBR|nr:hypothetical protein GH714_010310 [Hevea brasiliensis]
MTSVSLVGNSEREQKASLQHGGPVKVEVEATGVAESTVVEGQVDMIDVVVLPDMAGAAVMEIPRLMDLEVLQFDQVVNSEVLSEGQRESDSLRIEGGTLLTAAIGETPEGQTLLGASASEIVERQMLLAAKCPCA